MTKENADPKTLDRFKTRVNKKDSFERWFKKYGSI